MLLSKNVVVKNCKYYKDLGYNQNEKIIEIDIKHLPNGSNVKIEAICDYCSSKKEISYRDYNKNIKINGKFSCSIKCGCLKSRESNLIKYGLESVNQLESKKEKSRKTIEHKYGVNHISKLSKIRKSKSDKMKSQDVSDRISKYWKEKGSYNINEINNKRKNTCIEKWGIDYISKLEFIKEKVKKTNMEKWGGYTYQSNELLSKILSTNLQKYGCTHSSSSELVKNKIKKTNLNKYNFECCLMNEDIKIKSQKTIEEKYGVSNIMFCEDFRQKFEISKDPQYLKYISDRNYEFICNECNNVFIIDYDNYYQRRLRKTNICTNCYPILENSSIKEKELKNYILSIYDGQIISNYRDVLEIDIYIPELKIGFEFNGLYWHSKLDRNYHLNKSIYFSKKGIRIIHIWEDDWDNKKDILKSQIKNWVGISTNKIFARKCEIREISNSKLYRSFLNENHIQGYIRSIIKIGLYYNNELLSLMTFDNIEGRKKMKEGEWNLLRFCNKLNFNIIGSASKLLKYFIDNYKPNRIISYSDLDWSTGNLYYVLGFKVNSQIKPNYKYVINGFRVNKQKFTKIKLIKNGEDPLLTESKIMNSKNISKIYNCGQLKFEMNILNDIKIIDRKL